MSMRRAFLVVGAVMGALLVQARPCLAADDSAAAVAASPSVPAPAPAHRFAITPSWTRAFTRRSISNEAVGVSLQLFFDRQSRFGIGLAGALHGPFSSSFARSLAAAPAQETLGSVFTEFAWMPLRNSNVEVGVMGGVGALSTRPVSLVDPAHRSFSYGSRLAMSAGAVARVYLTPHVAVSLEARNVLYVEQEENTAVAAREPENPSTWYGAKPLTQMIETRLGLTVFLSAREAR